MTIYALSSGPGISGVAVVRVSGKETAEVVKKLTEGKNYPLQEWLPSKSSIKSTQMSS